MGLEQLEHLINELESSTDAESRERVLQALGPILDLHRDAFARVIAILRQNGDARLTNVMLQDPLLKELFEGYGVTEQPQPPTTNGNGRLISVEEILSRTAAATHDKWLPLLHEFELKDGEFLKMKLFDEEVMVCSIRKQAYAFKNHCPEGGGGLENGLLDGFDFACPCHGHRFNLRDGHCSSVPRLKLEVLQVSIEDGVIRMAI